MKKLLVLISLLFIPFVVQAKTINESVRYKIKDMDLNSKYELKITDPANNIITVIVEDYEIKDSYVTTEHGKVDLNRMTLMNCFQEDCTIVIGALYDTNNEVNGNTFKYEEYKDGNLINDKTNSLNSYRENINGSQKLIFDYSQKRLLKKTFSPIVIPVIVFLVSYLVIFLFVIINRKKGLRFLFSFKNGGLVKKSEISYYREIPNISLDKAYVALKNCSLIDTDKLKSGLIGAYILKWSKEGNIEIREKSSKVYEINLEKKQFEKTESEQLIYNMLKDAAKDSTLTKKEIKKYSKVHRRELDYIFKQIEREYYTENLHENAKELLGLKKFLLNFSTFKDKKHIEVHLWDEYLMFAELMGIAKKVNKQFKKMYPDMDGIVFDIGTVFTGYITFLIAHFIAMYISIFLTIFSSFITMFM